MTDYVSAYDGTGHKFQVEEAQRLAGQLRNSATITDGVIRWNSNSRVPPEDCVTLAAHVGLPVDVAKCDKARSDEISAFLAEVRKNDRAPTSEELFEMRAAFGPGATVVNVVTGRRTKL